MSMVIRSAPRIGNELPIPRVCKTSVRWIPVHRFLSWWRDSRGGNHGTEETGSIYSTHPSANLELEPTWVLGPAQAVIPDSSSPGVGVERKINLSPDW